MFSIGDVLEHEQYGEVEVLDVENKLMVSKIGTTEHDKRVKFLKLADELNRDNFIYQTVSSFDEATENLD